jgi:hypothetical protein
MTGAEATMTKTPHESMPKGLDSFLRIAWCSLSKGTSATLGCLRTSFTIPGRILSHLRPTSADDQADR